MQSLDVRSIGTQTVFGDDELEVRVVLAQFNDKPFGSMAFAIIFARAVMNASVKEISLSLRR